jgi:hypothetical protein
MEVQLSKMSLLMVLISPAFVLLLEWVANLCWTSLAGFSGFCDSSAAACFQQSAGCADSSIKVWPLHARIG